MTAPSSTQAIAVASQNTGDASSPAAFRQHLLRIIETDLADGTRIKPADNEAWLTVISGFSEHLLCNFPSSQESSWDVLYEKVALIDLSLDIFLRLLSKAETLFDGRAETALEIVLRLVCLCTTLGGHDYGAVVHQSEVPTPEQLTSKTFQVTVKVLSHLGDGTHSAGGKGSTLGWTALRNFLSHCSIVCEDILSQHTILLPSTVNLLNEPSIQPFVKSIGESLDPPLRVIVLDSERGIAELLSLLMQLCASVLSARPLSGPFLSDLIPRTSRTIQLAMSFFLDKKWCATDATCIRYISGGMAALQLLFNAQPCTVVEDICASMSLQLLLYRIQPQSEASRGTLDKVLERITPPSPRMSSKACAQAALQALSRHSHHDEATVDVAVRYLHSFVSSLDQETLRVIQSIFSPWSSPASESFLDAVQSRLVELSSAPPLHTTQGAMDVDLYRSPAMLARIVDCIQTVIGTAQEAHTDDLAPLRKEDLTSHILWMLHNGFPESVDTLSFDQKLSMLKALGDLPCLILSCNGSPCQRLEHAGDLTLGDVYVNIALRFLSSKRRPETQTRKLAFDAVTHSLRHHAYHVIPHSLHLIEEMAREDLANKTRGLRLAAGRLLVESIRLYDQFGREAWTRMDSSFDVFYRILDAETELIKETVLVTVTAIARVTSSDILCAAISCLISQLGNPNPVLRGLAYAQLISLARHFKKTPYKLVSPYMEKFAPYLVRHYSTQRSMLVEFCRLISLPPLDFINVNLPFALPPLFAVLDRRTLERLSEDLGIRLSSLFINNSEHILAHILLMSDQRQADRALDFILEILVNSVEGASQIDIQSVFKSCVVPLLALLVIHLGEIDHNNVIAAREALLKVERILGTDKREKKRQKSGEAPDLGTFLRGYILGIISHITDTLQDAKGKKSTESKREILRSIGRLAELLGPEISAIAPQIMTALQMSLNASELASAALESWAIFLRTLDVAHVAPHVGTSSAAIVWSWPKLSSDGRRLARECLQFLIVTLGEKQLGERLDDVVDLSDLPGLNDLHAKLVKRRRDFTSEKRLVAMLNRASSDNTLVIYFALRELRTYMNNHRDYFQSLAAGDNFNPLVGRMLSILLDDASRESDGIEDVRLMAYECIGALSALDPDRFEFVDGNKRDLVFKNLADNDESIRFAYYLITDVLVGAFRSTGVIAYQTHIAYALQQLLEFCSLTTARPGQSLSLRARRAWEGMPKHVIDTVTPLLNGRFVSTAPPLTEQELPIYPNQATYREWLPTWTSYLISRASGHNTKAIFLPLQSAVQGQDVGVARLVLPHIALNVLLSDNPADVQAIRAELIAVLEDQVNPESTSTKDKRLLSAQVIFMLMDHINEWVRLARQEQSSKKQENRRARSDTDEQLVRVDSVVSSIDQNLVAKAAFECKAYARSLMSFERHITVLRQREAQAKDLQLYYERIHEIYANIDEPDGMAGISSIILHPSLEHQIREHESNGQWTSAQSCWELSLQQSPDNLECHKGLLQCLRHLGHYDTLRTHVRGVLLRKPEWKSALENFQVEGAWMVGDWDEVKSLIDESPPETSEMAIARVLVAIQSYDKGAVHTALSQARMILGRPIAAAGAREYRRFYDAVLNLHILHEFEMIRTAISMMNGENCHNILVNLSHSLDYRLDATQPSYRIRGPILSMRRIAFGLHLAKSPILLQAEIGRSWLASAKIARKAGHMSTAYSALLQAKHHDTPYAFVQAAKLVRATGEDDRALRNLEHSLSLIEDSEPEGVIDLTGDPDVCDRTLLKAKAHLLRCRWMTKSDSYHDTEIQKAFSKATEIVPRYESATFYYGKFHNDNFNTSLSETERNGLRGLKLLVSTGRMFLRAMKYGSKFTYQTVPRLLMIWMDMGEDMKMAKTDTFGKIAAELSRSIPDIPAYKWYTAFPQIASRVGHSNEDVWSDLARIIKIVIREFPQQGMWQFASVTKSKNDIRSKRGRAVLDQLMNEARAEGNDTVVKVISQNTTMVEELLKLCDFPVKDQARKYNMRTQFLSLYRLAPSILIIPLQESLVASLPPTSASADSAHQPFPVNLPRFGEFKEEIEIMHSLAKPRKITIIGDNQQTYMFLGKPKDDLRKDARLMDFNALINKLLKANSDSRRRQLHIRTYGIVTLNEECGFIQWVPKTTPIRPVLVKNYEARGLKPWSGELGTIFDKIKEASDKDGGKIFRAKVLSIFNPVFHEWFTETFPEPSMWLASRLTYGRTAAVMSMVGFILGLGDRHCENILLDEGSGAVVHVDFNCLFERGKKLETPERVPFRLTQNLVDGLGITGVEGVFRVACEITMQILRDNRDTLMTVLDAFIHDPLVEWEDERKRLEKEKKHAHGGNHAKEVDMKQLARNALEPIRKKLSGIYATSGDAASKEREISTTSLVQTLILEATDDCNLGKMYPGWAPWH